MGDVRSDQTLQQQVDDMARNLELVSVAFDRAAGEVKNRAALDLPEGRDIPVNITVLLGHRYDDDSLAFRHDARVVIGEGEEGVHDAPAVVEASIIVQFKADSPLEPDDAKAQYLGRTYSHQIMYPYLREMVQTTLVRLGVTGATLGLLEAPG